MSKINKIIWIIIGIIIFVVVVQIVAADRYAAQVQVVEEVGKIGLNPLAEKLDFGDLARETSAIRYVSMENNGNFPIYVMVLKFGGISDLIKVSRNNFVLESGQKERLEFQIIIPVSAENKYYSGWVWIFKLPKLI
jgi:hypothetical protein